MRIWSVHPCYLDTRGLGALWNETLVGRNSLRRREGGWYRHSQLNRFRDLPDADDILASYLELVYFESVARGFNYDRDLIGPVRKCFLQVIEVTEGQVKHELALLRGRLEKRAPGHLRRWPRRQVINPIFRVVPGDRADWDKSTE
jgi:hypothetical protein